MMMNDDERGGEGVKNAQNLMTSYVNDPLQSHNDNIFQMFVPHHFTSSKPGFSWSIV